MVLRLQSASQPLNPFSAIQVSLEPWNILAINPHPQARTHAITCLQHYPSPRSGFTNDRQLFWFQSALISGRFHFPPTTSTSRARDFHYVLLAFLFSFILFLPFLRCSTCPRYWRVTRHSPPLSTGTAPIHTFSYRVLCIRETKYTILVSGIWSPKYVRDLALYTPIRAPNGSIVVDVDAFSHRLCVILLCTRVNKALQQGFFEEKKAVGLSFHSWTSQLFRSF